MLTELTAGGKFAWLRKAACAVCRDLKARYLKDVVSKWQSATTQDAINNGSIHTVDTLYSSVLDNDGTIKVPYGESNRRGNSNEEFIVPATNQHLVAWSEMTTTRNLVTSGHKRLPFAGNGIFTQFVTELTSINGKRPTLDALAVKVVYAMAKEHGINLNHGFGIKLAAQDWKTWYVQPPATRACPISSPTPGGHHPSLLPLSHPVQPPSQSHCCRLASACRVLNGETRKKGVLVDIVKQYIADKKAERERKQAA